MSTSLGSLRPLVQHWPRLGDRLRTDLWIVRDDLLPFPLAGNKVRKVMAELGTTLRPGDAVITNGGVDSNHCRTVAMFAAQRGARAHLVLHGQEDGSEGTALAMLRALGAECSLGPADSIAERVERTRTDFANEGLRVHVIAGGGHTPSGARAIKEAGIEVLREAGFSHVFVASGTGATQGGLVAASVEVAPQTEVVGVSVARDVARGAGPVQEAAEWAGAPNASVLFLDEYRAGGYGKTNAFVDRAVRLGWSHGLPLDPTYTGKAFSALVDWGREGRLDSKTLLWHTGGLWNWFASSGRGREYA